MVETGVAVGGGVVETGVAVGSGVAVGATVPIVATDMLSTSIYPLNTSATSSPR